ncbi:MAG: hypothetical protein JWO86_6476 [Myxococcaceae bacterium]|nr:hypothetical protein [Myxococcaceae bacterium]
MRLARFVAVLAGAAFVCAACGSYDTGIVGENAPEHACLDVIDAFARTAERCGADYATEHDRLVQRDAAGDCKNVRSIRDERTLRGTCIPFVKSQSCSDFTNGKLDPTCAEQLQRSI